MKKQDTNATAAAMAQQTPNAQTADQGEQQAAFAKLLRAYEHATATGADTAAPLYALATACALSVLKKVIDPQRQTAADRETVSNSGLSPALVAIRRGIMADIALLEKLTAAHNAAYALQYNADGDLVQMVIDPAAEKAAAVAQAVTDTKIEELTREVRAHNNFARRMPVVEEQIKVINHRINDLEGFHRPMN